MTDKYAELEEKAKYANLAAKPNFTEWAENIKQTIQLQVKTAKAGVARLTQALKCKPPQANKEAVLANELHITALIEELTREVKELENYVIANALTECFDQGYSYARRQYNDNNDKELPLDLGDRSKLTSAEDAAAMEIWLYDGLGREKPKEEPELYQTYNEERNKWQLVEQGTGKILAYRNQADPFHNVDKIIFKKD
jgi:hypothetical protein